MCKKLALLFSLMSLPLTAVQAQWYCQGTGNVANCPPCYRNQEPAIPTKGGQTWRNGVNQWVVNVSAQNSPSSFVGDAVDLGRDKWNNATDTTSSSGTTNRPPYVFENTNDPSQADVVIFFDPTFPGPGQYQAGQTPPRIVINPNYPGWTLETLSAVVAHELGHNRGLGNAYNTASGCSSADSIMGSNNNHTQVRDRDVYQMNRNYQDSTRGDCCADNVGNDPGADAACVDGDGDGISTCGGDCNDNDYDPQNYCGGSGGGTGGGGRVCDPEGEGWCYAHEGDWVESTCTCHYSPILVDVRGDGFNLTDATHGVTFDLDRDGGAERLAWTAAGSDDAWLVLDRNGNGMVDDGAELFGNFTPQSPPAGTPRNGFSALAEYDEPENGGDADGQINSGDAVFPGLRLWQDADHDGVSDPGELSALPASGVARILLDYRESRRADAYGNVFRYRAKVYGTDGQRPGRWAYDVFLVRGQ